MLTIGSLFSGVGGLELGLEWAGLGPVLWQVEASEFCRGELAKLWPNVERYKDVREFSAPVAVDLVCGGFPCQDVSSAGKGTGLAGERSGLWHEFARILAEARPTWVIVENVASGAKRWVNPVRADLGRIGYKTLPVPLSAADVGAPHLRRRIFIVGRDSDSDSESAQPGDAAQVAGLSGAARDAHGITGDEGGRGTAHPGVGHGSEPGSPRDADRPEATPHADSSAVRLQQQRGSGRRARGIRDEEAPQPGHPGKDAADGNGARLQGTLTIPRPIAWKVAAGGPWATDTVPEPAIRRVADGVPDRVAARRRNLELKALGNAVVPQCAEVIGWMIRELNGGASVAWQSGAE